MSIVAEPNLDGPCSHTPIGDRAIRLAGQPAHRLELRVQPGERYSIVRVWGELYISRLSELSRALDGLVRAGHVRILLDLSRLYDLDGDAIAELSRWQAGLAASGGGLWLAAPRPWVRRLMEHLCLRGTFTVYPCGLAALADLAPSSSSS